MPIYEYQCSNCNHHLEALQKISDETLKTCPECGKDMLNKLISPASVQFKGSGWYVTDYSKKGTDSKGTENKSEGSKNSSEAKTNETQTNTPITNESSKGKNE